jgi:diacylglycerol kinase (ATP)
MASGGRAPLTMNHPQKARGGWNRIVRATGYSFAGLGAAWRHESAFRQECLLALVLWPVAVWLGRSWVETALLAGSVMLVLIVELLNSAIEAAVDRVSPDLHPLSKRAKDIGSAAVMLAIVTCALLWLSALWRLWSE